MKPLEIIRLERLENMLAWRLAKGANANQIAEAEAIDWAIQQIHKCFDCGNEKDSNEPPTTN